FNVADDARLLAMVDARAPSGTPLRRIELLAEATRIVQERHGASRRIGKKWLRRWVLRMQAVTYISSWHMVRTSRAHHALTMTRAHCSDAYKSSFSAACITGGFEDSGIWPLSRDAVKADALRIADMLAAVHGPPRGTWRWRRCACGGRR